MILFQDFWDFIYAFYVVAITLASLLSIPIVLYLKKLKPTIDNKKKYSNLAEIIYYDVDVYFKRFDIFNAKSYFNPFKLDTYSLLFNNTYEFYRADIIVLESSIVIFSKHKFLWFKFNLFSFKIIFRKTNTDLMYDIFTFNCLSTDFKNKNLELEFNDYTYNKSIVLGIKNVGEEIQQYLKDVDIHSQKNSIKY